MDDPIDETIEAFEELKQEGVIRYYGISSIRPNVIREYVKRSNIVSVMSQYSILDSRPEEEVLPLLDEHGISLIARGPLAKGILTDNGYAKADNGFLDYTREELLELHGKLITLLDGGTNLTQTALRYPLSHPAVATVIPGASTLHQLLHNIQAGDVQPLPPQVCEAIRRISKPGRYAQHR